MDIATLATLLMTLPGVVALINMIIKSRAEKSKTEAEAAQALVTSAVDLATAKDTIIDDLRRRVAKLEEEVNASKKDREKLHGDIEELAKLVERGRDYVLSLYKQIESLGSSPPETPEDLKKENWPESIK